MKTLLLYVTLCIFSLQLATGGGDYDHDFDSSGMAEWLHQDAHSDNKPEWYLVCDYAVRVQPHGIKHLAAKGWEEVVISCTVVDSIRGGKKVGERFEYRRYREGKSKNTKSLIGGLRYVFFVESADGKRFVDPQDPASVWKHSKELARVVESHRPKKK